MFGYDWPTLIAAAIIGIIAVARLTRLVTDDEFPPMLWLRNKWIGMFPASGWAGLILCSFCVSPYIAAISLAWAITTDLQPAWWVVHGWLALAYLAAIVTTRDLPADQRE
jgi:hypothetical protein